MGEEFRESTREHYDLSFYTGDLRSDIVTRLSNLYPNISLEELMHVADNTITDMSKQGNMALYQGLVLYCVQKAKDKCKNL